MNESAESEAPKPARECRKENEIKDRGGPKSAPDFVEPMNPPQDPPETLPEGHGVRVMPPTQQHPDGYWVQTNQYGQPVNPATGKPPSNVTRGEGRAQVHVPLPLRSAE